jgi:hypothetical protein
VPDGHVGAILPPTEVRCDIVRELHCIRVIAAYSGYSLKKCEQGAHLRERSFRRKEEHLLTERTQIISTSLLLFTHIIIHIKTENSAVALNVSFINEEESFVTHKSNNFLPVRNGLVAISLTSSEQLV